MALLFCDGADHISTTAQLMQKWTANTANTNQTVGSGQGRAGSNSISANGGSSGGELRKNIPLTQTVIVGFATTRTGWANQTLIRLYGGGALHIDIRTDASGIPQVTRNGTVLGTAVEGLQPGYHHFEIKVKIDDTTGTVELRVNGATVIGPLTSQDTRNAGSAGVDMLALFTLIGGSYHFDDVTICDTTGSQANDFLGDVRVQAIFPNGNGNYSDFVGSDGNSTDNYLLVDETSPNDDTDYVQSATVNAKDTYAYTNVTALTGTVHAVVNYMWARKTEAGLRQFASLARSGGTDEDGATKTMSLGYAYYSDIRHTKPGGGAWTITDVNAAEFGTKVIA